MIQFLLAYWWLILIALAVVALITKSILKVVMSAVAFVVVFVVVWQILIQPGLTESNQCFIADAKASNSLNETATRMSPGPDRNEYVCTESAKSLELLVQCLRDSKQSNSLSFLVFSNLPWFDSNFEEVIISQNQNCPKNQVILPIF